MEVLTLEDQELFKEIQKSDIWLYENRLPENLCDLIIEEFAEIESYDATVGINNIVSKEIRNVKTIEVPRSHWVHGIPMYYGFDANYENFKYQISDVAFTEFFTYTEGSFYKPHIDISPYPGNPTHRRKLTVIIQLSDESDYEGGELHIYNSALKPITMSKKRGSIIVFSSNIIHRVTPVKSGIRHVLASWIIGNPFS